MVRRKKKLLTPKQKLIKESAEQRFKIEKLVFIWQEKLFSQPKISPVTLQRAAIYLQPRTFEEVVEERVVQEWCGYPLCDSPPKTDDLQKYKISLSQRKVYDQSELANYCSEACYHKSKYFIMQLSEEPVWFRDLNAVPTAHIILLDEDFKTAIKHEKRKTQLLKSNDDIRNDYVQHLLANVPKDTQSKFEIVEKTTVPPPSSIVDQSSVYDSIEGYRIEIKKDGKSPSTFILKKKKQEEIKKEQDEKRKKEEEEQMANESFQDDPDALFETMMMLKEMNLDKQDQIVTPPLPTEPTQVTETTVKAKPAAEIKPAEIKPMVEARKKPAVKKGNTPAAESSAKAEDTNVIKVTSEKPKKPIKKKKSTVPELSLFGTIWTILDHLTTKATRTYLNELQTNHRRVDVLALLDKELMDDANYLRGQILSERILDTYGLIRTQLNIKENMEDDIVNVIKTFKLSDASMVALNPAQCYMITLVLVKALADILVETSNWKDQFEDCCKTIDQSTDMVDACVRVLKIASV
ncbi:Rtr1/RPAP2 family-domain-containing protein [Thamnidium elegans]|nr:Rtr1/RPAP2 family-domain-containing protein [Thamnidium elegans]